MNFPKLGAYLKTRRVRGPGLQGMETPPVRCRPRALTRRSGCIFEQALTAWALGWNTLRFGRARLSQRAVLDVRPRAAR